MLTINLQCYFLIADARTSTAGRALRCRSAVHPIDHTRHRHRRGYIIYGRFIDHLLECDWLMINVLGGPTSNWTCPMHGQVRRPGTKSAADWRQSPARSCCDWWSNNTTRHAVFIRAFSHQFSGINRYALKNCPCSVTIVRDFCLISSPRKIDFSL